MRRIVIALLLLALPAAGAAQGLGQAAAKEREKRQKMDPRKPPPPSFSNDDLDSEKKKKEEEEKRAAGTEKDPEIINRASDSPQRNRGSDHDYDRQNMEENSGGSDGSGGNRDSSLNEAEWKSRAAEAWSRVQEVEDQTRDADAQLKELRDRLNPMSASYEQDTSKILALQDELGHALALVESRKQELASAREEYGNFEREARLAGVPPGWVRPPH